MRGPVSAILREYPWPVIICVWTPQTLEYITSAAPRCPRARRFDATDWRVITPGKNNKQDAGNKVSAEFFGTQPWLVYNVQSASIEYGILEFLQAVARRGTYVIALNPPPIDAEALEDHPELAHLCVEEGVMTSRAIELLRLIAPTTDGLKRLIKDTRSDARIIPLMFWEEGDSLL